MNIPILGDGAGAFSMGAAVAGAVSRSLRSIYCLSLANSSSVKSARPPSSSFKNCSCTPPYFSTEVFQRGSKDSTLSVLISLLSSTGRVRDGPDGVGDVSLKCR